MNDHYARILHEDRMAELRREASWSQQRRSDQGLKRRVAAMFGRARDLSTRLTNRRFGPGTEETPHVRERRMPPAKTTISS